MTKKTISLILAMMLMIGILSSCTNNSSPVSTEAPLSVTTIPTVNPEVAEEPSVSETETIIETEVAPTTETKTPISGLKPGQMRAINTLNYLTSLLQDIHDSKQNRIYLQEAFTSLKDNTHPEIDSITQSYITDMLNTLSNLRMLSVKRDHLEYIYEQKKAQALKAAIPNPLSVLNVVQAGNPIKTIASLAFMAIDSVGSYLAATSDNDLQYLQDGWDLDEQETKQLDQSQIGAFNYIADIVRDSDLHGEEALLAMSQTSVQEFINIKNTTNIHSRIQALKDNEKTYAGFGGYWLLLAQSYYELGQYADSLKAFASYESLHMDIFRKDHDYASTIPLIISAACETMPAEEYIPFAQKYLEALMNNCENNQWNLRYFAAITYLDLYAKSQNESYLEQAFYIAKNNINYLIKDQTDRNSTYLKPVDKIDTKNMKDKDKKDAEQVNKARIEKRKKELPPVYEPLWLNCSLLFSLAQEYDVPEVEKREIEAILHNNDHPLFLVEPLNDLCWFEPKDNRTTASESIEYNKGELSMPAKYLCDDYTITVYLTEGENQATFNDWTIDTVERKAEGNLDTFVAKFKSKKASEHKYQDDAIANIVISLKKDSEIPSISAKFKAVPDYISFVKTNIHFERVEE